MAFPEMHKSHLRAEPAARGHLPASIPARPADRNRGAIRLPRTDSGELSLLRGQAFAQVAGWSAARCRLLADSRNPAGAGPTHEFSSADKQWVVSLTREFLALTCRHYERWERFRDTLRGPLDALLEIYTPSFYTRVGLRYIDLIRRSVLGLDQVGWDQLLKPWVAGPFGSPEIASTVEHAASDFLIAVPEIESRLRVRHGVVLHPDSQESCYLIDADFFDERRTEITDVFPRFDALNRQAGLFFRWCIRDRLHEAMRPPSPCLKRRARVSMAASKPAAGGWGSDELPSEHPFLGNNRRSGGAGVDADPHSLPLAFEPDTRQGSQRSSGITLRDVAVLSRARSGDDRAATSRVHTRELGATYDRPPFHIAED